ncbi:MAG: CHRD domain-containing protein [Candidatus Krumholzibacteriia bacterium]
MSIARRIMLIGAFSLLLAGGAAALEWSFVAGLDGTEVVPPTPVTGTGHAALFLNAAQTEVAYYLEYQGLVDVTGAHLHIGAFGENGPVVFPLESGQSVTGTWMPTATEVEALFLGNIYVQVHTSAFPNGAIRGQFEPCGVTAEETSWSAVRRLFR